MKQHSLHSTEGEKGPDEGVWEPCAEGQLAAMAAQLKQQRRRRQWTGAATVLGTLVVLLAAGAFWVSRMGTEGTAALTCREIVPMLAKYDEGQLPATKQDQISEHLRRCPGCQERYQRLQAADPTSWRLDSTMDQLSVAIP